MITESDFSRRRAGSFLLNATRLRRDREIERIFADEDAAPNEPILLLQMEIDYSKARQYQAERGRRTHPGRWQNLTIEVYLL